MQRCIELAALGEGMVAPNPLVGSVIVHNHAIIGEGFHRKFGGAHAEVNAIRSVQNPALLADSALYVNLEPCVHHGKTPPCVDLILECGIKKVVIAHADPNPMVGGMGIAKLREAGVEVISGILENEARFLNRRFISFHALHRPFVVLKWAQTRDGLIDRKRDGEKGVNWITSPEVQPLVHLWRSQEMAILVGRRTIEIDDPQLSVRTVIGRQPVRLVLDPMGMITSDHKIQNDDGTTFIFSYEGSIAADNRRIFINRTSDFLPAVLQHLYQLNIQSILVEGGAATINHFIHQNLWDEARIIYGNVSFGEGLAAPEIGLQPTSVSNYANHIYETYFRGIEFKTR